MPERRGSAILSSASEPKRRVTKSPSVSSSSPFRAGTKRSRPMRSLPAGEMSGDNRKGLNLVGTSKKTPSGNRTGLPLGKDVDLPGCVVGAEQPLRQTELQRQVQGPGLLGRQEGVGASFHDKTALFAVDDVGEDPAAPTVGRLVDRAHDGNTLGCRLLLHVPGRAQPADAPADHGHVKRPRGLRPRGLIVNSSLSPPPTAPQVIGFCRRGTRERNRQADGRCPEGCRAVPRAPG